MFLHSGDFYLTLLSLPSLHVIHVYLGLLPHLVGRPVLYSSHYIGRWSETRPTPPGSPAHNNLPLSKTPDLTITDI